MANPNGNWNIGGGQEEFWYPTGENNILGLAAVPPGNYSMQVACYEWSSTGPVIETGAYQSQPFAVTGPAPTLNVSSTTVARGGTLQVSPAESCAPYGPEANVYAFGGAGGAALANVNSSGTWGPVTINVPATQAPGVYYINAACGNYGNYPRYSQDPLTGPALAYRPVAITVTGGLVVAFGDSYAAGEGDPAPQGITGAQCTDSPPAPYCGYDSGNWTDSTDAYPNVLAGKLGDNVDNFAISGASASTSASNTTYLPNCSSSGRPSVLEGELASAATLGLHPSLVTLTIGGNDVNFESCFTDVFGVPAINGAPCSDSTDAIAQIKRNVTMVLKHINKLYPGVPIVVTEYADPLPKVFSGKNPDSLCSQHALIYAAYEGAVLGKFWSAIATWVSNDHDGAGINYLNSAYSKAQSITQALDNALNAAVTTAASSGVNAHAVALNFASHGLCQDYPGGNTGWLLAPSVKLVVHTLGVVNKTYSYVASDTCAYADGGCSQFGPKTFSGSYHGIKYKLTFSANINDLPHPTIAGQQAIASQLMPAVTTLLGTG